MATAAVSVLGRDKATQPGWVFPMSLERYDLREELSEAERSALFALGPKALRRNRARGIPRRNASHWKALTRFLEQSGEAPVGMLGLPAHFWLTAKL